MKTPEQLIAHLRATNNPAGVRRLARNWRIAAYVLLVAAIIALLADAYIVGAIALAVYVLFTKEASACSGWAGGYEVGRRRERDPEQEG